MTILVGKKHCCLCRKIIGRSRARRAKACQLEILNEESEQLRPEEEEEKDESSECSRSEHARRLFQDILTGYNKLLRPVQNTSDAVTVKVKLRLSQLLDVVWTDSNINWDPNDYGGVDVLYVPADQLWTPNVVLYNNADGNYQVSAVTKAAVYYNGTVVWEPPAIYKSMCPIDIEWFPFDEQLCDLKFGSWTYDGFEVDLIHYDKDDVQITRENGRLVWIVPNGVDLSDFLPSTEWDVMAVPVKRHEERYECCRAPYIDITFYIYLRRRTLFYSVNLIIPCIGISFLTILVFYLPSDSGEKVSLSVSILICLTMFFNLLVEIIPSTSLIIPLIGKYLLFTMVMITLSIAVTVFTLNVHYRLPATHRFSVWIRYLFLDFLPKLLMMRRPEPEPLSVATVDKAPAFELNQSENVIMMTMLPKLGKTAEVAGQSSSSTSPQQTWFDEEENAAIASAVRSTCFIANHFRKKAAEDEVKDDWRYIANVLDRLFLWTFSLTFISGTCLIMLQAPSIHDSRHPIV
ncbi:Acetylcholine receptor subunit alpha-type unc-63 [Trichinella murrelli]|uniref:Acetylcholine receptor subunit alpha-type unc-63 n=1 Tax=Trichinella murrelli TaxID=144512 RepID=A0A0V0U7W4_9BILA|nr:Acetylcholine receptor subunit alpha-type unc-63 [Trichinella murrelli]